MIHTGAVAVLDALGFKGIWEAWDPAVVIAKYRDAASAAEHLERETMIAGPVADQFQQVRRIRFLSDTIVYGSSIVPKPNVDPSDSQLRGYQYYALMDVCRVVAALQSLFMVGALPPPLALRGAIAWGQFTIEDQLLIGPATDEAAEGEKCVDAAIVWFCPSAHAALEHALSRPLGPGLYRADEFPVVRHWHVAMKNGVTRATVVKPMGSNDDLVTGLWRAFFERRAFVPNGARIKYENTRAFLVATPEFY